MNLFTKFLIGVAVFASCSHVKKDEFKIESKKAPEYQGVDPQLQAYVDQYFQLSAENHIAFKQRVTVGFKRLDYIKSKRKGSRVIGLCTYGKDWREIDVDPDFWAKSNVSEHYALLFHELTHCYCTRGHDFGKDKPYPEGDVGTVINDFMWNAFKKRPEGYFETEDLSGYCPLSLMFPMVLNPDCFKHHTEHYLKEMFDHCQPW